MKNKENKTKTHATIYKNAFFSGLAATVCIGLGSPVHAAVIVAEGFSYTDGALAGNSGGTGDWGGSLWAVSSGTGGNVSGNALETDQTDWDSREVSTAFNATGGPADLYFSTTFTKTGTDTSYALWVEIANAAGVNTGTGIQFGLVDDTFSLRRSDQSGGDGGSYTVGDTVELVGKIEFNTSGSNETITLWVDPTDVETSAFSLSRADYDVGWVTPTHVTAGNFVLNDGTGVIDDIVLGTTWDDVSAIPEPSSAALIGGLVGLALVLRRRK